MLRTALLSLLLVSLHEAQAKIPHIGKRSLFYIGKHKHSDKVVIWGETSKITDKMLGLIDTKKPLDVKVMYVNPRDVKAMETALREPGARWYRNKDYRNYELFSFMLSKPSETDKIFKEIVENSPELTILDGYVDRIEEVDGVIKLLDKDGNMVSPATIKNAHECARAEEGDACYLLYQGFVNKYRHQQLNEQEEIFKVIDKESAIAENKEEPAVYVSIEYTEEEEAVLNYFKNMGKAVVYNDSVLVNLEKKFFQ